MAMARLRDDSPPRPLISHELHRQLSEAEEIARYAWAAAFCRQRRVLDVSGGVGRGPELILSRGAATVTAIRTSDAALELSSGASSSAVAYERGEPGALPYESRTFDVVLALSVRQDARYVRQLVAEWGRVLGPEGLLLVSAPAGPRSSADGGPGRGNLSRSELEAVLGAAFESVRIIAQEAVVGSLIGRPDGADAPGMSIQVEADSEMDAETELLALAGRELPPQREPVGWLMPFAPAEQWLKETAAYRRQIADHERRLLAVAGREADAQAALARLADAEQELAALRARGGDLEATRRDLEATRRERDEVREALAAASADLAQLRGIAASRSWQMAAFVRDIARRVARGGR